MIVPNGAVEPETVRLVRTMRGRKPGLIKLFRSESAEIRAGTTEFGRYLPSMIIGCTSGENETLSIPFLVSRSGYADHVARAALNGGTEQAIPDNRLMLIDYATNLEVLFANLVLVAYFSQIVPYFADGKETFKVCRPAAGPRTFSFVQFNEFRNRLLSPLDGIVDAAPEPASIKWTLMSRTCH